MAFWPMSLKGSQNNAMEIGRASGIAAGTIAAEKERAEATTTPWLFGSAFRPISMTSSHCFRCVKNHDVHIFPPEPSFASTAPRGTKSALAMAGFEFSVVWVVNSAQRSRTFTTSSTYRMAHI